MRRVEIAKALKIPTRFRIRPGQAKAVAFDRSSPMPRSRRSRNVPILSPRASPTG